MAAARGRQMPHPRPRAQPTAVVLDRRPRLDTTRRAEPAPVVDERGGIEAKAKRRGNVDHDLAPNRDRSQRQRLRSGLWCLLPLPLDRIFEHEGRDQEGDEYHAPIVQEPDRTSTRLNSYH